MIRLLLVFLWILVINGLYAQVPFNEFFESKTLRIDYFLAGNKTSEIVYFREMKQESRWGGNPRKLIDLRESGTYRYLLKDSATGVLLFSRGFSSLFQEWAGTPEAARIDRAFPMTAVMPFPKKTVKFHIEKRDYMTGKFEPLFSMFVNPLDYFINHEIPFTWPAERIHISGDPSECLDIAFIADGYTEAELEKFVRDATRMADYFLSQPPYNEFIERINFYAVQCPSHESGVDIPGKDIYANTILNSSFYTWDMDRYLTSFDTKTIYDAAASVPYDAIFILNNSSRYGGGGFFNHYGQSTVDHNLSEKVAIHEFGHSFAGLADEYYTSEVTYSDFYNLKVEPWEPNITTMIDFAGKWKKMVGKDIPIPTPREESYKGITGVFEGGGYVSRGVFSPAMDCRMKSNDAPGFCPVCQEAIRKMIRFYCD